MNLLAVSHVNLLNFGAKGGNGKEKICTGKDASQDQPTAFDVTEDAEEA